MRLVLLGPPGAGKGTQAVHIAQAFSIPRIATGDIFRRNAATATDLGRVAKAYMDRGELVPDDVVIGMVRDRLGEQDAVNGFLLDGFPRTVPQAMSLEDVLASNDTPLDVVVRFTLPEDEIVRRIVNRRTCPTDGSVYHLDFAPPEQDNVCDLCGTPLVHRADDTEPVVRRRLEEYHAKTERLEYFYWERGLLRDVESVGPVEDVTRRTLAVLHDIADGDAA
ncbi:MAG: adenylate kinase [Actinomycetota bacterium]|nr:adenylate kinase [Actinomycetota bacterium]